jgi:hypothetical protein
MSVQMGSSGEDVREVQQALVDKGYHVGSVDGSFGVKTDAAVRYYQSCNGLTVDGIVGPVTAGSLGVELDRPHGGGGGGHGGPSGTTTEMDEMVVTAGPVLIFAADPALSGRTLSWGVQNNGGDGSGMDAVVFQDSNGSGQSAQVSWQESGHTSNTHHYDMSSLAAGDYDITVTLNAGSDGLEQSRTVGVTLQ